MATSRPEGDGHVTGIRVCLYSCVLVLYVLVLRTYGYMLPDSPEGDGHVTGTIYASGTIDASSYSYICVRILIYVSSSYARVRAHRSEGEHDALSSWLLEHEALRPWLLEHAALSMWPYATAY
jgi:hypothetical protein